MATGFLYGHVVERRPNKTTVYRTYLVTNRHVVNAAPRASLRFNPKGNAPAREYAADFVDAAGKPLWFAPSDPKVDVVVLPIDYSRLEADGISVALVDAQNNAANRSKMASLGVAEGDFVYILGFPFGDVGGERSYVVARSGSLARVSDTIQGFRRDFLVDVMTVPGNSGGPIFSKPELVSIEGTKAQAASLLLGVTSASINVVDEAVSKQTQRTRITFEDNSGLSIAYPVDFIDEAISYHLASEDARGQPATNVPPSPPVPTPPPDPSASPPSGEHAP